MRRTMKNHGNKSAYGNTERRVMIKDNKNSSNKKSSNKKNRKCYNCGIPGVLQMNVENQNLNYPLLTSSEKSFCKEFASKADE